MTEKQKQRSTNRHWPNMATFTETPSSPPSSTTCTHYKRKCLLIAPCCGEPHSCRFCHDAIHVDDWKLDPEQTHPMNRHDVTEIICVECHTRQPATNACTTCDIPFAAYYCAICHLYDDDAPAKGVYHCASCGICRVGGRENFQHCNTCNMCIPVTATDHTCRSAVTGNCPVCMEDMWSSRETCFMMRCKHYIHTDCFNALSKTTVKCPLCSESFVEKEGLVGMNASIDAEIALTPMPEEYANVMVKVLCNDCHEESTVKFHIFGHKCASEKDGVVCGSYNTRRI